MFLRPNEKQAAILFKTFSCKSQNKHTEANKKNVNPAALLSVILDGHCSRHTDATSRGIEQGSVAPFCLHRLSTSISRIKPQYLVN